jgi:hypothetical protein
MSMVLEQQKQLSKIIDEVSTLSGTVGDVLR